MAAACLVQATNLILLTATFFAFQPLALATPLFSTCLIVQAFPTRELATTPIGPGTTGFFQLRAGFRKTTAPLMTNRSLLATNLVTGQMWTDTHTSITHLVLSALFAFDLTATTIRKDTTFLAQRFARVRQAALLLIADLQRLTTVIMAHAFLVRGVAESTGIQLFRIADTLTVKAFFTIATLVIGSARRQRLVATDGGKPN